MEKDILCRHRGKKKAGVSILILTSRFSVQDKVDFSTRIVTRDKEGHYIKMKGSDYQENIPVLTVYVLITELQNT